jgi:hypothetical protein
MSSSLMIFFCYNHVFFFSLCFSSLPVLKNGNTVWRGKQQSRTGKPVLKHGLSKSTSPSGKRSPYPIGQACRERLQSAKMDQSIDIPASFLVVYERTSTIDHSGWIHQHWCQTRNRCPRNPHIKFAEQLNNAILSGTFLYTPSTIVSVAHLQFHLLADQPLY